MKVLQDIFDRLRPDFEKGGKLELFYPLFEAKETFLFVPGARTTNGAHIRDRIDSKRFMATVIAALVPALLFGIYNTGYQYYMAKGVDPMFVNCWVVGAWYVLPIVLTSYAVGGIWELLFAVVRKHELNEGFLVTGLLFPLVLPPTIPLWQVALGISFGVVIGKEVFGGTGMNIFNPALTARVFLFFAFAPNMSGEKVWAVKDAGSVLADGYSGATPLATVAAATQGGAASVVESLTTFGQASGFADYSLCNLFMGLIPGSIGETSTLAILIGAVYLLITGVASWRIMLSCVIGAALMTWLLNFGFAPKDNLADFRHLPFRYHFVSGGFAFGLVFMTTDPVTAPATNVGKWIYGALIGAFAILIRVVNPAYAEGMMLAILFMNAFSPLIDYFVVERNVAWRLQRAKA